MGPRAVLNFIITLRRRDAEQILLQRPDVRIDRHAVVVQDHEQVGVRGSGVVESLESQSSGQRAVADHGDHLALLAPQSRRGGHAQRGGDRSRGVSRAERVVLAFAHARETAQPVQLAIRQEPVAPTRDDLVGISLMAHVPDQLVVRRVEDVVQRGGQLDDSQTRPQMPRIGRKLLDDEMPQLAAVGPQLVRREPSKVPGRIDLIKIFVRRSCHGEIRID